MEKCVIMCRSLTYAQAAARTLERGGISATVVKLPQSVVNTGCSYGVQIAWRRLDDGVQLLRRQGKPFGKVLRYLEAGGMEEVRV